MKTVILTWNPSISHYSADDFSRDFLIIADGETPNLSWNVGKNNMLEEGDRFFVIRQGMGSTGVAIAGYLNSDSYEDDERDGKNNYKVNLDPMIYFHTDRGPHITMKDLRQLVPGIDWDNVVSGTELKDEQSAKIEDELLHFVYERHDVFDNVRATTAWNYDIEDFETITPSLQAYYKKNRGCKCEKCGKKEGEVIEMAYHFILGDNPDYSVPFNKRLHCLCSDCWFGEDSEL